MNIHTLINANQPIVSCPPILVSPLFIYFSPPPPPPHLLASHTCLHSQRSAGAVCILTEKWIPFPSMSLLFRLCLKGENRFIVQSAWSYLRRPKGQRGSVQSYRCSERRQLKSREQEVLSLPNKPLTQFFSRCRELPAVGCDLHKHFVCSTEAPWQQTPTNSASVSRNNRKKTTSCQADASGVISLLTVFCIVYRHVRNGGSIKSDRRRGAQEEDSLMFMSRKGPTSYLCHNANQGARAGIQRQSRRIYSPCHMCLVYVCVWVGLASVLLISHKFLTVPNRLSVSQQTEINQHISFICMRVCEHPSLHVIHTAEPLCSPTGEGTGHSVGDAAGSHITPTLTISQYETHFASDNRPKTVQLYVSVWGTDGWEKTIGPPGMRRSSEPGFMIT